MSSRSQHRNGARAQRTVTACPSTIAPERRAAMGLDPVTALAPLKVVGAPVLVRLDLACGETPREGFDGVDLYAPIAKQRWSVLRFPWPLADSSVDELHCSHFLEHVPMRECVESDGGYVGVDLLVAWMNEAWRVLKPGSVLTAIVPNARSNRAFQDPTHRRFFVQESFLYFNKGWRESQKLGHYLGATCNFDYVCNPILPVENTLYAPEAAARYAAERWNFIADWHTVLKAVKPDAVQV